MVLLLLAKMAADFAPAALIWFVASTHRVPSEFELLADFQASRAHATPRA